MSPAGSAPRSLRPTERRVRSQREQIGSTALPGQDAGVGLLRQVQLIVLIGKVRTFDSALLTCPSRDGCGHIIMVLAMGPNSKACPRRRRRWCEFVGALPRVAVELKNASVALASNVTVNSWSGRGRTGAPRRPYRPQSTSQLPGGARQRGYAAWASWNRTRTTRRRRRGACHQEGGQRSDASSARRDNPTDAGSSPGCAARMDTDGESGPRPRNDAALAADAADAGKLLLGHPHEVGFDYPWGPGDIGDAWPTCAVAPGHGCGPNGLTTRCFGGGA